MVVKYIANLKNSLSRPPLPMAYRVEAVISKVSQHLDLNGLRTRVLEKPRSKAGQVRQAWPDIKDLLAAGHSLKDIWAGLNESGLDIGYARLSHYISQLRLRDQAAQAPIRDLLRGFASVPAEQPQPDQPAGQGQAGPAVTSDPLRNLREQRARKRGFEYDPFPTKGLTE
jgi:hypothetical protein